MKEQLYKIWRRCAPPFFRYPQKNLRGGGYPPPPAGARVKGDIPPCSKLSFIPKLYVKRFSTLHWSCRSFFSIKNCVACKKSTLRILINLDFVTSFEDGHYILLFRYIYGAQLIQWFCYSNTFMSTAIIGRMVLQRHYPLSAILLTPLSIFARLSTLR